MPEAKVALRPEADFPYASQRKLAKSVYGRDDSERHLQRCRTVVAQCEAGLSACLGDFLRATIRQHSQAGRLFPLVDGVQFTFDEGETLTVWHPTRWDISPARFEILEASRVRWEWFYYGREKLPENRYYLDCTACGDVAAVSTNVDWFQTSSEIRRQGAAAELL